jgi:hypothetical protein
VRRIGSWLDKAKS